MIRNIHSNEITKAVAELCKQSNIYADPFIQEGIKKAYENEKESLPVYAAKMILDNIEIAKEEQMPLCQDTGMVVVFVDIGQDVHIQGNIAQAINEGVRIAYHENYFRMSVVNCPLERVPTGDNTPAVIHYNIIEGNGLKISVMPKGFGSENKSAVKMLKPSDGILGVKKFVIETVRNAGRDPCPPIIVGVGIGGTMEKAALLAKEALLKTGYTQYSALRNELLDEINDLKIGIAGLGGNLTALDVRILTYPTHIAGLPVAVNISCHVARHASQELYSNSVRNCLCRRRRRSRFITAACTLDSVHEAGTGFIPVPMPSGNAINMKTPFDEKMINSLRAGDFINLSGYIYTARDAAHKLMHEALKKNDAPPFDYNGQVVFYAGPCPAPPGKPIGSVGPTTAGRMDLYAPDLIAAGLKIMIGKGERTDEVVDAIKKHKGLYLVAVGGVAALLARCVKSSEIINYDFLETEAIRRLYVDEMPLIVAIDGNGRRM